MNKQESMTFAQIVYILALFGASNGQLGTWINFEGRTYFVSDSEEYPYEAEIMCHVLNSSLVTQSENLDNFSRNLPADKYYWIVGPSVGQKLNTSLVQEPSRQASLFSVYSSPISTARTLSAHATDMTGSSAVSQNIQINSVYSSIFGRHIPDVSSSITAETQLPNLISNIEIQSSVTSAISSSSAPKDHPIWSTFPEGYTQSWIYQTCTKYETSVMSSTIIVTMYVSSSSVRSTDATPNCSCFINSADSSIYNLEDILAELAVDSKNTAKYNRKHTSADDKRTSAKAVGYVGALVICSLIGALIILDGKSFCRGFGRIHIRDRRKSDLHD